MELVHVKIIGELDYVYELVVKGFLEVRGGNFPA